jgi:hypothetical protein
VKLNERARREWLNVANNGKKLRVSWRWQRMPRVSARGALMPGGALALRCCWLVGRARWRRRRYECRGDIAGHAGVSHRSTPRAMGKQQTKKQGASSARAAEAPGAAFAGCAPNSSKCFS